MDLSLDDVSSVIRLVREVCDAIVTIIDKPGMPPLEYWKIATPIITGALGFLFGRQSK